MVEMVTSEGMQFAATSATVPSAAPDAPEESAEEEDVSEEPVPSVVEEMVSLPEFPFPPSLLPLPLFPLSAAPELLFSAVVSIG